MKYFYGAIFYFSLITANAQVYDGLIDKDFSNANIGNIHSGHNEIILTYYHSN